MPKELPAERLDKIEEVTLAHYDNNALSFWQGTKDHDVTQNYQAFLNQFPAAQGLPRVLQELHTALRPGGILFSSNPRGNNEGWSGQRYGYFIEFEAAEVYLEAAGFTVLNHYYRPAGVPRAEQPWLAIVSQKTG